MKYKNKNKNNNNNNAMIIQKNIISIKKKNSFLININLILNILN